MDSPVDPDIAANNHPRPSVCVPSHPIPQAPACPSPEESAAPWQDYQTVFTNAKAGMESVDKAHVQKIVYEMSKDSAHFRNEQRKAAQLEDRIGQLKARSAAITPAELAAATRAVDQRISSLECCRDLSRTWLHADMDCFYAAVHEAERPELKQLPVAVGGMGMISTANYVARKYGVRSAMPGFIGKRLCPQLVFITPDFKRYTAAAERVRQVFRQLDPDFESGGLDEAYLDITVYCTRTGCTGEEAAEELRRRVRESCGGLTCSCGVAPNKMLAKICSDINKPDGQYVLPPSRAAILSFLDTLPTRKIPCIGKVTEQLLRGVLGIATCGGLLGPMRGRLQLLFSETATGFFLEAALGLAASRHGPKIDPSQEPGRKGISCERTFRNMREPREQEDMARQLVESLAADMAAEQLEGRNLTLKLKLSTFEVRTRAATLPRYVRTASDMLPTVARLLRAEGPLELRLMGVRMAALRKINAAVSSPLARLLGLKQLKPANDANAVNGKNRRSDQHGETRDNNDKNTREEQVLDAEAAEAPVDLADDDDDEGGEGEQLPGDTDLHLDPDPDLGLGDGDWQNYDHHGHCGDGDLGVGPAAPLVQTFRDPNLRSHHHQGDEGGITTADTATAAAAMTTTVEVAAPPAKRHRTDNNVDGAFSSSPSASSSSSLGVAVAAAVAADTADGGYSHHLRYELQDSSDDGGDRRCRRRGNTSSTHAVAAATSAVAAVATTSQKEAAAAARGGTAGVVDLECKAAGRRDGGGDGSGNGFGVGVSGSTGALWSCRVCTYAHNRRQLLRCELCDCLRSSTQPPPPPPPPPPQPQPPTALRQLQQHHHQEQQQQHPHAHNQHQQRYAQRRQQSPRNLQSQQQQQHRTQSQGRPAPPSSSSSAHLPSGPRSLVQLWAAAAAAVVASANQPSTSSPSHGFKLCPQCGVAVAIGRWVEHQDWHLALRLSREGGSG